MYICTIAKKTVDDQWLSHPWQWKSRVQRLQRWAQSSPAGRAASNHSPWRDRVQAAGHHHHTSFPQHIRHSLVQALSHPCHCGVVTLSLTPQTVHLPWQTHSLSPMCFPFGQQGSTGQGGQGESPSCSRSWLSSDSRTGPAVSHADMQQHAASGCMQNHNKPRPAGHIVRVAIIKELFLWSTFTLEIFPKEIKVRHLDNVAGLRTAAYRSRQTEAHRQVQQPPLDLLTQP